MAGLLSTLRSTRWRNSLITAAAAVSLVGVSVAMASSA